MGWTQAKRTEKGSPYIEKNGELCSKNGQDLLTVTLFSAQSSLFWAKATQCIAPMQTFQAMFLYLEVAQSSVESQHCKNKVPNICVVLKKNGIRR